MWLRIVLCCFVIGLTTNQPLVAQDSTKPKKTIVTKIDSLKPAHSPKIALRRSAIIPGWGQVYNKQIWKVPIIYGALGVTAYIFFDNVKWYQRTRYAFNVRSNPLSTPAEIANINARLIDLTKEDLSFYRRQFRRDVDYSVLFFLGFWGLNIADAVVFAHLKEFDVGNKISGTIKLGNSSIAHTTGFNLNFDFHSKKTTKLFIIP